MEWRKPVRVVVSDAKPSDWKDKATGGEFNMELVGHSATVLGLSEDDSYVVAMVGGQKKNCERNAGIFILHVTI